MDESEMQNAIISPLEFEGQYIIAKLEYVLQSLYLKVERKLSTFNLEQKMLALLTIG